MESVMRVVSWRVSAAEQFDALFDYVRSRNAGAAERLFVDFTERIERLAEWPGIGRPGREPGTREFIVHPNYIVVYKVTRDEIDILRVLHARQRYP